MLDSEYSVIKSDVIKRFDCTMFVCKIIQSLKLVDYLHELADNPWYNYYLLHAVASGSDIMSHVKIYKPLVVYIFSSVR